ncbi:MAG: TadE/TadG family type IV pilus assembly protein [Candidatus Acidiferrales bacterium]|jgi:hypothetical protein
MQRKSEKGQSLIEFALILPFFIVLLLAGADMLMAMSAKQNLNYVATQTAMWCAKQPQPCDLGVAQFNAQIIATGLQMQNPPSLLVTLGQPPPPGFVSLIVTYTDAPIFAGFFPTFQWSVTATATIGP